MRANACVWCLSFATALLALTPSLHATEAPALLLAKVLPDHVDPKDYLVSEKLDGARALWDGTSLKFRSGDRVNAPKWFTDKLPKIALDGELWIARGKFELLSGIVRKNEPIDGEWREVKYMVFELPGAPGTFEERANRLDAIVRQTNLAAVAGRGAVSCGRPESAEEKTRCTRQSGCRRPDAASRRCALRHGQERRALQIETARRHRSQGRPPSSPARENTPGKMGALRVQMPDGREFNIGTGFTDAQRANPPAIGTEVTYSHRGLTNTGLPRFASFVRVRERF